MSRHVDEILSLIDAGVGSSREGGYVQIRADRCARCTRVDPVEGSEFCGPCRRWLLGDGPDPMPTAAPARRSPIDYGMPRGQIVRHVDGILSNDDPANLEHGYVGPSDEYLFLMDGVG